MTAPVRLRPNRRFPSIPAVSDDLRNHTQVLTAMKEAVEVGKRDTTDVLNSYLRVKDFVDMGLASMESGLLTPIAAGSGGEDGPVDASDVAYSGSGSGLAADNVQSAIDEVVRNTVSVVTSSSGVVTLDISLGDYFTLALSENVSSWVITNPPGAGRGFTVMVEITQDSTPRTVATPGTTAGGAALDVSTGSGAVDLLAITSFDGGTTLRSSIAKAFS